MRYNVFSVMFRFNTNIQEKNRKEIMLKSIFNIKNKL